MKKIIYSLLLFPFITLAQNAPDLPTGIKPIPDILKEPKDLITQIDEVAVWIYTALLSLAVIFIVIAAFYYLTAAGNSDKITKAHKMLAYSIAAVAIAILSKGIIFVVDKLLTTTT